jgi:FAD synthase
MPIIDRSEEIDIDIGLNLQEIEPKIDENKTLSSNPILKEIEEEEIEKDNNLFEKSTKSEEKVFYETLTDTEKDAWDRGWRNTRKRNSCIK